MSTDLLVVGGGPIGCKMASLTGGEINTIILEEHPQVGRPVQCTGLVTPRVVEMADAQDAVLNEFRGADVHFPDGEILELRGKEVKAVIMDRERFDASLQSQAVDAGAQLLPSHTYLSHSLTSEGVEVSVETKEGVRRMGTSMLVAADGFRSRVARVAGLGRPRELIRGMQVDIDRPAEDDKVDVYLGRNIAPGFFAWSIPCGEFTRLGLCVSSRAGPPHDFLNTFIKRIGLDGHEVLRRYSGVIPIGALGRTFDDRLLVVGDAAGQAKPLSGGGLYTGMTAARLAASAALNAFKEGDMSREFLSRYQKAWKEEIGGELGRGYRLRRIFLRLNDEKLSELGTILRRPELTPLLAGGDIDYPSRLAPSLLRQAPSMLRFLPQVLGSLFGR